MNRYILCLGLSCLFVACERTRCFASQDYPENTSELWKQYREARLSGEEPVLADFSYAGYAWGAEEIPSTDGWPVFDVTDYGAVADDGLSDKAAVLKAIAAAADAPKAVIYFPAGRFRINDESDAHNEPILIERGHIVLRGAGAAEGGTELFMERHMDADNPDQLWTCPYQLQFKGPWRRGPTVPVVADSRRESFEVEVADVSGFQPGDWVWLSLRDESPAAVAEAVAPYEPDSEWTALVNKGVMVEEEHQIRAINGRRLTFEAPIHVDVRADRPWEVTKFNPLEQVGVERLALVGDWQEDFVHHKSAIHNGGWSALSFLRCANSWVRDVRFVDVNRAMSVSSSVAVTVRDAIIEGNPGHNAISFGHSSHCLLRDVDDRAGQWHSFGVSHASSGNVFLDSAYTPDTCYESHAAQPRWNLFDRVQGGWMYGRWGGAAFNQPNHLHGLVFWNYRNTGAGEPGNFHFMRPDSRFGRIIMPYVIGFHGNPQTFAEEEATVESNGSPVYPPSLYKAQLELRRSMERE